MGWSAADIPNQQGRIALITGANSGLGLETARALKHCGATVVLACRSPRKAELAKQELLQELEHLLIQILVMLDRGDTSVQLRQNKKVSLPLLKKILMYLQGVTLVFLLLVLTMINYKTVEFPSLIQTRKKTLR